MLRSYPMGGGFETHPCGRDATQPVGSRLCARLVSRVRPDNLEAKSSHCFPPRCCYDAFRSLSFSRLRNRTFPGNSMRSRCRVARAASFWPSASRASAVSHP